VKSNLENQVDWDQYDVNGIVIGEPSCYLTLETFGYSCVAFGCKLGSNDSRNYLLLCSNCMCKIIIVNFGKNR
jgi:hypothetical protein